MDHEERTIFRIELFIAAIGIAVLAWAFFGEVPEADPFAPVAERAE
ncbi:hypothetical protein [Mesorhizobium sp. NBSH29]|nr:hypothetical protein [Mesorhizobium sp. NBSH29]